MFTIRRAVIAFSIFSVGNGIHETYKGIIIDHNISFNSSSYNLTTFEHRMSNFIKGIISDKNSSQSYKPSSFTNFDIAITHFVKGCTVPTIKIVFIPIAGVINAIQDVRR